MSSKENRKDPVWHTDGGVTTSTLTVTWIGAEPVSQTR